MRSAEGGKDRPPPSVLEAFGLRGSPERLVGGQGTAFEVDGAVLKRADDEAEASFVQSVAARVQPVDFGLAAPMAASDGRWVHHGWIANRRLAGLRPAAPDWAGIIAAGEALAAATTAASAGLGRSALADRTHRWAVSDRHAWDERRVALDPTAQAIDDRLRSLAAGPASADAGVGLVHADLAGNVHLDASGTPVVLDLSLYERPTAWGSAVVVVDALLWHGATGELVERIGDRVGGVAMLARAARFRLVADALAPGTAADTVLDRYQRLATILDAR